MGWKAVKEHYGIRHDVQVVKGKGICIGSPYVHDLIVIDEAGRVIPNRIVGADGELGRYVAEMESDPAKLKELMARPDTFERSLPVFTYEGAEIIECQCEELGWPNVTHDGRMMYENTFSPNRGEVIRWAIKNARAGIETWTEIVDQRTKDLGEAERRLLERKVNLHKLAQVDTLPEGRDATRLDAKQG